ncbi:hypothetical protein DFS34DRAFT_457564 [Phlyctochytrium arcticum]|nr:hypothetical protein DFS34DRAFT_457564 [Phlyctochytrium arcticum]
MLADKEQEYTTFVESTGDSNLAPYVVKKKKKKKPIDPSWFGAAPVPPPGYSERLQCATCEKMVKRDGYSKVQVRQDDRRRCKHCIQEYQDSFLDFEPPPPAPAPAPAPAPVPVPGPPKKTISPKSAAKRSRKVQQWQALAAQGEASSPPKQQIKDQINQIFIDDAQPKIKREFPKAVSSNEAVIRQPSPGPSYADRTRQSPANQPKVQSAGPSLDNKTSRTPTQKTYPGQVPAKKAGGSIESNQGGKVDPFALAARFKAVAVNTPAKPGQVMNIDVARAARKTAQVNEPERSPSPEKQDTRPIAQSDSYRKRQIDELQLLNSMFPGEGEIEWVTPGLENCVQLDAALEQVAASCAFGESQILKFSIKVTGDEPNNLDPCILHFQLPPRYPFEPALIEFSCNKQFPHVAKAINAEIRKAESELTPDEEEGYSHSLFHIYAIVNASIMDALDSMSSVVAAAKTAQPKVSSTPAQKSDDINVPTMGRRCFIKSHHIASTEKRKNMRAWALELELGLVCKIGFPGFILVEGSTDAVQEFVRRVKSMRWQQLNVKAEEEFDVENAQDWRKICRKDQLPVVTEMENVGEFVSRLQRCGLFHLYEEGTSTIHR